MEEPIHWLEKWYLVWVTLVVIKLYMLVQVVKGLMAIESGFWLTLQT